MSTWLAMPIPSPRTISASPAPLPTPLRPTNGCSKSSSRCFSAASSTVSGSPTRRSPNSKPISRKPPDPSPAFPPDRITFRRRFMEAAIDRIMQTYDLLLNRTTAASEEARAKVTEYVQTLFEAGEKDPHRLTVCGLTYLRQLDGSNDPVKAGFTGL